ncbi:hypothetical protein HFP51_07690 [Parasphingopyxis sp. CP4]|uniref:response regulator receiver domain n=1 Tax=Parasphingopyxis sp. CP4 TaxID=2724527 RepID=UPI0015A4AA2A|nr:response regulator receiver domain [Parasphingopyxis sp. CP4]QLC22071.1 hypothetical protein HFP51_07690 [Parasphingopyxis sp. CP4]
MSGPTNFADDRRNAAGLFAQTMLVIDDEALQADVEEKPEPAAPMVAPARGASRPALPQSPSPPTAIAPVGNRLNAKKLIERSLDLGIICSVLRIKADDNSIKRIVRAAENADIVSLDWDVESDGGDLAKKLITKIVRSDIRRNGRLRLISIYTSLRSRASILRQIQETLREKLHREFSRTIECVTGESPDGLTRLRIVCLLKTDGIRPIMPVQKRFEVGEKDLPDRLLVEFSNLSEGLLGNVAMATIASVRDVTHHVLQVFDRNMDGPYFHHRATIDNPTEAEDYGIDLVLSEIKKAVIRKSISPFLDKSAIGRSIETKFNGQDKTLTFETPGNSPNGEVEFTPDQTKVLIQEGLDWFSENGHANAIQGFKKKGVGKGISTLFEADLQKSNAQLARFASQSQLSFQPRGHRVRCEDYGPNLTTGTIIRMPKGAGILICLQAVCDTVRRPKTSPFIFARLEAVSKVENQPVFVVPVQVAGEIEYQIFALSSSAYSDLLSIDFDAEESSQTVRAKTTQGRAGFHFFGSDGSAYQWLGTSKSKRSMRAVYGIAQNMSRIGFEEFAPFRAH